MSKEKWQTASLLLGQWTTQQVASHILLLETTPSGGRSLNTHWWAWVKCSQVFQVSEIPVHCLHVRLQRPCFMGYMCGPQFLSNACYMHMYLESIATNIWKPYTQLAVVSLSSWYTFAISVFKTKLERQRETSTSSVLFNQTAVRVCTKRCLESKCTVWDILKIIIDHRLKRYTSHVVQPCPLLLNWTAFY